MASLDIFKSSAFSTMSMTRAIVGVPFIPGRISRLGIFESEPIRTTIATIERRNDTVTIVPTTPRGGPGIQNTKDPRNLRPIHVPHYQMDDAVIADEVQNIRAFGTESELESVQNEVNRRLRRMAGSLDTTIEWARMGAIRGEIVDVRPPATPGGARTTEVILNLFSAFGVTQSTVSFALSTGTTEILIKTSDVSKIMEDALGGDTYTNIHAFVGRDFWNALITHAKVTAAYSNYLAFRGSAGNILTVDMRYMGFTFGTITFEEYRGQVAGQVFIPSNEGIAFPVGVPGLFVSVFAPADYVETVNTLGLPRYARQYTREDGKAVMMDAQTNHLAYCTRPELLVKLTM